MKLVDDLFQMYRNHLTGDEEDAPAIVMSVLEDFNRKDLLKLIKEMKEHELYQMVGLYMVENLKYKMAREGIGEMNMETGRDVTRFH